jgi:hypothetical protein
MFPRHREEKISFILTPSLRQHLRAGVVLLLVTRMTDRQSMVSWFHAAASGPSDVTPEGVRA